MAWKNGNIHPQRMGLKASPDRSSETTTQRIAEKHIHT